MSFGIFVLIMLNKNSLKGNEDAKSFSTPYIPPVSHLESAHILLFTNLLFQWIYRLLLVPFDPVVHVPVMLHSVLMISGLIISLGFVPHLLPLTCQHVGSGSIHKPLNKTENCYKLILKEFILFVHTLGVRFG